MSDTFVVREALAARLDGGMAAHSSRCIYPVHVWRMRFFVLVVLATSSVLQGCGAPDSPPNAVRYLALGDSLTMGVGAGDSAGAFPAVLAEKWRAAGCAVELKNVGVGGYTSTEIRADQLSQIDAFKPTVITFQAGTNDIFKGVDIDEYRRNVDAILDAAEGAGARVVVMSQFDWTRAPSLRAPGARLPNADMAAQRTAYDDVIIAEAQAHRAQFVDLRNLFTQEADRDEWFEDGLHPTRAVYSEWAGALADAVPAPCKG